MPIFMDRHDVSKDVTAEIVAELHQKDLKIQAKYNCNGLTYWFDDKRKTAFCLVEAPNKAALKEMHDKAHGEVPNQIIEVDQAVVESFLGRIEDPEKSQKTRLNIINDPAFRSIMVLGRRPGFLQKNTTSRSDQFIYEQQVILDTIRSFEGRVVKKNRDQYLVSFFSVTKAVLCALKIQKLFPPYTLPEIKTGLSAGVPVDEKDGFFETSIKAAQTFFGFVPGGIVMSSEVKELFESENPGNLLKSHSIVWLNKPEEDFLSRLIDFMEKEWANPALSIADLSGRLGFSKSRLYRKMVSLTGKSPNSFIKDYRLQKALQLLNDRLLNISEIAFESGFNSAAYFSKCFQERFGILPSQYLKQFFPEDPETAKH